MKRLKRALCLLACLLALAGAAGAEEVYPPREYEFTHKAYRSYDSETLKYRMETFKVHGIRCYLTKVWMQDPARQIRKATAEWKKNIMLPQHMAEKIPGARFYMVRDGGHVQHWEQLEAYNKLTLDFLLEK